MLVWLSLCGVALLCACVLVWLSGRRARSLLGQLPSLPTVPLLGNAHQIMGDGAHMYHLLLKVTKIMEDSELPFVAWLGPRPAIVIKDPDDVKAVTNAFTEKPYYYTFARIWVGNGLVTAPTSIWKKNIKKLAGTFTASIVDGYQTVYNVQAAKLVERLRAEADSGPFNMLDKHITYTTLESICQTALGVPSAKGNMVSAEYYEAFNKCLELMVVRFKNVFHHLDFFYGFSTDHKQMKTSVDILHTVSETMIKRRRLEREKLKRNGTLQNDNLENGKSKFKSFLDILLDLNEVDQALSEKQIRDEVNTIIVGGQETAALSSNMTLLMVGSRPDVQKKVYSELKEIFGDSKRPIEKEDLQRMEYLEAVIMETLRLYPPIPCVMRNADRDLKLKSCTIPKDTHCALNIWAAGRSKKVWGADAEEFRPERWLEDSLTATIVPGFYVFSYGKRACIGKRYAMALLKTVLTYILREFEVESDIKKLAFRIDVSLKPCSGNLMRIRPRDGGTK